MKIKLVENGMDSLQKGYGYLLEYEKAIIDKLDDLNRYLILKDAIISLHHGTEILLKHILLKHSEFLLFKDLSKSTKEAFRERRAKSLESIFQTTLCNKVNTVSYMEAYERIKYFCGHNFNKEFESKIIELNEIRNQITHSEIHKDEIEVVRLFNGFLDELDHYFFKYVGDDYKTMTGYGLLKSNNEKYKEFLNKQGYELKAKFIEVIGKILESNKLSVGLNEVKRVEDIKVANNILNNLIENDFTFGADLYNGICSGKVTNIRMIDKEHLSIFTEDNNLELIIKFKSLIFTLPDIDSNNSPMFFVESDNDAGKKEEYKNIIVSDHYENKEYFEGIYFIEEERISFDQQEINELYIRSDFDESFAMPPYHRIYQYVSKSMFAFLNIQGLRFGNMSHYITKVRDVDGRTLEINLRNSLTK